MRVLTLTNCYPPHYYGGYELTCRDVMEHFRAAGHEVTVLASDARVPGVDDIDEPHVRRTLTAYWDWQGGECVPTNPSRRLAIERRNLAALAEVLADVRPDVVSAWHMLGLSLSLLTSIERAELPIVLTVANDWLIDGPSYDGWSRMWPRWPVSVPRAVRGVPTRLPELSKATVNFVSDFTKQRAINASPWPVRRDSPVIRPGIDLADFPISSPAPAERAWRWRILYVGRMDPTKGVSTLLHAFAALPATAHLKLLGGGSVGYQEEMWTLANRLGIAERVTMGRVSRHELHVHYRAADVVVFPSEWEEPFGLVPLEAMACGVPVVATGTGGSSEFLTDGENHLHFQPKDVAGLTRALWMLAEDSTLRGRLIAGGRTTAGRLTVDRYATELLGLHMDSCSKGVAVRPL